MGVAEAEKAVEEDCILVTVDGRPHLMHYSLVEVRPEDEWMLELEDVDYEDKENDDPCVYFVQAGDEWGPIKIGVSTPKKMPSRLSALQTGNPLPLTVRRMVKGGYELEGRLHQENAERRLRGEWVKGPIQLASRLTVSRELTTDSARVARNQARELRERYGA